MTTQFTHNDNSLVEYQYAQVKVVVMVVTKKTNIKMYP
jgi:hypothetical protein